MLMGQIYVMPPEPFSWWFLVHSDFKLCQQVLVFSGFDSGVPSLQADWLPSCLPPVFKLTGAVEKGNLGITSCLDQNSKFDLHSSVAMF